MLNWDVQETMLPGPKVPHQWIASVLINHRDNRRDVITKLHRLPWRGEIEILWARQEEDEDIDWELAQAGIHKGMELNNWMFLDWTHQTALLGDGICYCQCLEEV